MEDKFSSALLSTLLDSCGLSREKRKPDTSIQLTEVQAYVNVFSIYLTHKVKKHKSSQHLTSLLPRNASLKCKPSDMEEDCGSNSSRISLIQKCTDLIFPFSKIRLTGNHQRESSTAHRNELMGNNQFVEGPEFQASLNIGSHVSLLIFTFAPERDSHKE